MADILVTGAAGFIGYHLARRLLADGHAVVGIDNLNNYYDVNLKLARLAQLNNNPIFIFQEIELSNFEAVTQLFKQHNFKYVINLAAQPGVRYSLENPHAYIQSNLVGFFNVMEACRLHSIQHLVYASSSSVYGANKKLPYAVHDNVDHPLSLYAATKKSNELMAHCYSHIYGLPTTGLRFFTVYGPWGRPDMAMFSFTRDIIDGNTIKLFNYGNHYRDFTYIDDIIESMVRVIAKIPSAATSEAIALTPATSNAPWRIYNIGNQQPIQLFEYIKILEKYTGKVAKTELVPAQPGDVQDTHADVSDLAAAIDYTPQVSIDEGVKRFVDWYKTYYKSVRM